MNDNYNVLYNYRFGLGFRLDFGFGLGLGLRLGLVFLGEVAIITFCNAYNESKRAKSERSYAHLLFFVF